MTNNRNTKQPTYFGLDAGHMLSNTTTLGKGARRRIMAALRMSSACVVFGRQRSIGALGCIPSGKSGFALSSALGTLLALGLAAPASANTITTDNICGTPGAGAVVGNEPAQGPVSEPIDGSGSLSTVAGCAADGHDQLGVVVFGSQADAFGTGAVAVGYNADAVKWASAFGLDANASATGSVALGFSAVSSGANAVAIGSAGGNGTTPLSVANSTTASATGAVALGSNATRGAQATAADAIAIGGEATATSNGAVAIGNATNAAEENSLAIGVAAEALGRDGIAIGRNANSGAMGQNVAIGSGATFSNAATESEGAIAIGVDQQATGNGAVALGSVNTATGDGSVAIGRSNNATGEGSLALGDSTDATASRAVALGTTSDASSDSAIAIGNGAVAQTGLGATAIGRLAGANEAGTIAVGSSANANAINAIALGTGAQASGQNSISIGTGNVVNGANSGAIGDPSIIDAANSYSVGNNNTLAAGSDNSFVLGNDVNIGAGISETVALGNASSVTQVGGVALGANSVASTASGVAGYDPVTGAPSTDVSATWQSTASAVSVGDAANGVTRQITGVAAGAEETDAVNVAQLQAAQAEATTHYYSVNDSGVQGGNYDNDGATGTNALAAGVGALADDADSVAIGTDAQATGGDADGGAVAIGRIARANGDGATAIGSETIANADGATAIGDDANALASFSTAVGDGAEVGGLSATGVALGTEATVSGFSPGGVAIGPLATVSASTSTALGAGASATVTGGVALGSGSVASTAAGETGYIPTGALAADAAAIAATDSTARGAVSVGSAGNTRQITNLAAGTQDSDAVNVAQLTAVESLANAGWNVTDGTTGANIGPDGTVTFEGDTNITVTQTGVDDDGAVEIALNPDVDLTAGGSLTIGDTVINNDGLTIAGGPSVTMTGIDAADTVITNVAPGINPTDAVNVDQLTAAQEAATTHYYSVNSTATSAGSNYNNDGATGANAMAAGAGALAASDDSLAIGDGAQIANTNSDMAVSIGAQSSANGLGAIALGGNAVAANYSSIAIGLNATASDGASVVIGSSAEASGNQMVVAGSSAGASSTGTGHVILGYTAGASMTAGVRDNVAIGRNSMTGATAGGFPAWGESVAVGVNSGSQSDGVRNTLVGGYSGHQSAGQHNAYLGHSSGRGATGSRNVALGYEANMDATSEDTVAAGYRAIAGADGAVAMGATSQALGERSIAVGYDAIATGSIATGASSRAGNGGAAYGDGAVATYNGGVTDPAIDAGAALGENALADVSGATALGTDSSVTVEDGVALGSSSVADTAAGVAGYDPVTGLASTDTSPTWQSTAGAVSVGDAANGVTRQITDVAAGTQDSDAVNVAQLQAAQAEATTHFYSVNGAPTDGNYNNDGATGTDALAAGVGTLAAGNGATAVGRNASAAGQGGSVAVGQGASAPGIAVVAVGNNAGSGMDPASRNIVAIGASAAQNANAPYSVVVGSSAGLSAQGQDNVLIGRQSASNLVGGGNTVMGSFALRESQGAGNTVVGYGSGFETIGNNNAAFGPGAGREVTGDGNTGIGRRAGRNVTGDNNVSLGSDAGNNVTANSTVSIGDSSGANADRAVAIGSGSSSIVEDGVALGSNSVADTDAGVAGYDPATGLASTDTTPTWQSTSGAMSVGDAANGVTRQITDVAAGTELTDAVNVAQLQQVESLANAGWNVTDADGNTANIGPDGTVTFEGDNNITVAQTGADDEGVVEIALNPDVDLTAAGSMTVGDTVVDTTGLAVTDGVTTTAVVANGVTSGGVVLSGVSNDITGLSNTMLTDPTFATVGRAATEEQLALVNQTASAGWNVTAQGANGTNVAVNSPTGNSVDLNNADGNITVDKAADSNDVTFGLAADLVIDNSITVGDTIVNGDSVTTTNLTVTGDTQLGDNFVVNEGGAYYDGPITEDTHIVNKQYVDNSITDAVSSVNIGFAGNSGGTVTRSSGQVLTIQGEGTTAGTYSGENIRTETDPATGAVNIQMADSPTFGNVTVNADGTGKITGVTDATLSSTSTEAVNGSQLVALGDSIASSLSPGSTYDPTTNAINTQIVVGGDVYNNVESAIQAVNSSAAAGWNVTSGSTGSGVSTGSSVANVAPGATATFTAGNNMMIHQNGTEVQVALNPNLTEIESIAVTGGPTINGDGIDMGGDRITNLAPGVAPTDAVNVGQLNAGLSNTLNQANIYTDNAIADVRFDLSQFRRDANGGTASAMAMGTVPQAFEPGMGIMGFGVAHWQGQQAFAVGFSKASDDGRVVIRASGTYNTRRQAGVAVGAGIQF